MVSSLKYIGGKPHPYSIRAWQALERRGGTSLAVALALKPASIRGASTFVPTKSSLTAYECFANEVCGTCNTCITCIICIICIICVCCITCIFVSLCYLLHQSGRFSRTSATRHTSLGESLRFFPGPLLSLNRGGGFPYSGLQERSHGGLNLLIMRTKPHQMTLSLREKELSLRDMALHIRSVR